MFSEILTNVMNALWILGAVYCLYQLIVRDKMSIEYMRHKVAEAYDGDSWKKRVSRMPDTQVEAIYDRLLESGRISIISSVKNGYRGRVLIVDETAHGRGEDICENTSENRVRTDAIPGQIEFGDL